MTASGCEKGPPPAGCPSALSFRERPIEPTFATPKADVMRGGPAAHDVSDEVGLIFEDPVTLGQALALVN